MSFKLTVADVEDGKSKALANAESLIKEAQLLFDHGYFARAYALSHLAGEEFGKIIMLVSIGGQCLAGEKVELKPFMRRFRSHEEKLKNLLAFDEVSTGPRDDTEEDRRWVELLKQEAMFNLRKNSSLYVEFEHGHFSSPAEAVPEILAKSHLMLSWKRLEAIRDFCKVTGAALRQFEKTPSSFRKIYLRLMRENFPWVK